jgi:hypothetical protein
MRLNKNHFTRAREGAQKKSDRRENGSRASRARLALAARAEFSESPEISDRKTIRGAYN